VIDEIWSLLPYGSFGFGYGFISGEFSKWCGVVVWYCDIYGDHLVMVLYLLWEHRSCLRCGWHQLLYYIILSWEIIGRKGKVHWVSHLRVHDIEKLQIERRIFTRRRWLSFRVKVMALMYVIVVDGVDSENKTVYVSMSTRTNYFSFRVDSVGQVNICLDPHVFAEKMKSRRRSDEVRLT